MQPAVKRDFVRVGIALGLTVVGFAFYAWYTEATEELRGTIVTEIKDAPAQRVWTSGKNAFLAYALRHGNLTRWRIDADAERPSTEVVDIHVEGAEPESIAVAPDGLQAYWLSGATLVRTAFRGADIRRSVVEPAEPRSILTIPSEGAGAIIGPSGSVRLFHLQTLEILATGTIPVTAADLTEASGPFIAVADRSSGRVAVIDTRVRNRVALTELRSYGMRVSAIALAAGGRLAVATESGSIISGETVGAPGLVRGLQFHGEQSFLVAGDFPGVHLVPLQGKSEELARSEPAVQGLAATQEFYVLRLPGRLQLYRSAIVLVSNRRWDQVLAIAAGIWIVVAFFWKRRLLAALLRKLLEFLRILFQGDEHRPKTRKQPFKVIPELAPPSSHLFEASSQNEIIVFAGEEFSRPCGFPLWRTFILGLIDRLYDSLLLDPDSAEVARAAHRRGEVDRVANALLPFVTANPEVLLDYARSMYKKASMLSQTHEALTRIGVGGIVTPNLDLLLERTFALSEERAFAAAEAGDALSTMIRQEFVALKLRGVWSRPATLRIWPSDAQHANASNLPLKKLLGAMLMHRTMIFLGASLDEIATWLDPADLPSTPERPHYALVVKADHNTPKKAHDLLLRYNIETMAYPAGNGADAVIDFLSRLAAQTSNTSDTATAAAGD